ncbi:hypothetical protein ACLKA7_014939 [Drosophila subpalustris]
MAVQGIEDRRDRDRDRDREMPPCLSFLGLPIVCSIILEKDWDIDNDNGNDLDLVLELPDDADTLDSIEIQ